MVSSWLKAKIVVDLLLQCKYHKRVKLGLTSHLHGLNNENGIISSSLKINFGRRERKNRRATH